MRQSSVPVLLVLLMTVIFCVTTMMTSTTTAAATPKNYHHRLYRHRPSHNWRVGGDKKRAQATQLAVAGARNVARRALNHNNNNKKFKSLRKNNSKMVLHKKRGHGDASSTPVTPSSDFRLFSLMNNVGQSIASLQGFF